MPPRELIRLGEVIIGPGELEFVGNLEKSRFRTHLKLFARFIGYVHYSRSKTRKKKYRTVTACLTLCYPYLISQQPFKISVIIPILQMMTLRHR